MQKLILIEKMSHIIDNIFIGDKYDVTNPDFMKKNNIEAVLNTAFELPRSPYTKYYLKLAMSDSADEQILPNLVLAYSFLQEQSAQGRNVIVHCSVGMSRSVSMVVGYLILKGMPFSTALNLVKRRRPIADPNSGFLKQLKALA